MKLRCKGIDLSVGYEAAAALTAVLLLDREDRIVCCLLAAMLHELGHLLMMLFCGVRVRGIRLRLFDILIEAQDAPSFSADILITLGGAAMNFLCAGALCPFSLKWGLPHLALGIFNLLPLMSFDGGHLLERCLSRRLSAHTAAVVLRVTTVVFLLPLTTAGWYLLCTSRYNYSLLVISLYLTAMLLLKR